MKTGPLFLILVVLFGICFFSSAEETADNTPYYTKAHYLFAKAEKEGDPYQAYDYYEEALKYAQYSYGSEVMEASKQDDIKNLIEDCRKNIGDFKEKIERKDRLESLKREARYYQSRSTLAVGNLGFIYSAPGYARNKALQYYEEALVYADTAEDRRQIEEDIRLLEQRRIY